MAKTYRLYCIGFETRESRRLRAPDRADLITACDVSVHAGSPLPLGRTYHYEVICEGRGTIELPPALRCIGHELGGKIALCVDDLN